MSFLPQKQSFMIPVAKRPEKQETCDVAHDTKLQRKKGGYQKMWLCIPTSVQEFPHQIDAHFKKMCKFIFQQREPPYHFIISLQMQKLPSTFKKFDYVKKVVPHTEEKRSLAELSKIYNLIYCNPLQKIKIGNIRVDEQKNDDDDDDDDDNDNGGDNEDETIVSDFCFKLMDGIPLLQIQESCGPVSGVIFQKNFIKLCEFSSQYDKLKEEEVYSKLCQEIRKGTSSFEEIEAKSNTNPLESRIFYRNFQELNKIFEQTQEEILSHSLLEGRNIQELQKSIIQKQDRALSRLFLRSLKQLQGFSDGILPSKKLKTV